MHELSIAQAIVDLVVEESERASASRVLGVTLSLGELSGVVEEQLRFCFPIVARGTLAEGAELKVEVVAGQGLCPRCEAPFPMPRLLEPCPRCGALTSEVLAGRELSVASLEIE